MSTQTTYTSTQLSPDADAAFEDGLATVRAGRGEHRLLIGDGWRPGGDEPFEERNPARLSEVLGNFAAADAGDVAAAVAAARVAQHDWARRPFAERVALLTGAGEHIRRRAGEVAATLTLEVGKNRLESMGEVDEAVELIRYYDAQAADGFDIPLASASPLDHNVSAMRPFGVFGVIAPFNFPLALLLGPTVAALLTGNTVVAKPSPTTSRVAVLVAELLLEAGLPGGVFNLVTGGDGTGRALVSSRDLDGIVFTGSYAVGQSIAAQFLTDGGYARPCITEMGGKNPAIVTARADLDKAAAGITRSAWGLSGQKCSACSRVLVESGVHDELVAMLAERATEWRPSDPSQAGSRLGPVHTVEAYERFRRGVAAARADGRVVAGGATLGDGDALDGYYAEPTIVTELPDDHHLIRDEQFVPLLAVERVDSLQQALERANDQPYGLTAGMFSEDDAEVDAFLEGIEAGTLFVNRAAGATSGGWPGQQTYPGWKGSGSTNRGGLGPRYVAQFLREQGRNIVRG
jgi:1-pyrroline-5-carboxylate dehydrogenase